MLLVDLMSVLSHHGACGIIGEAHLDHRRTPVLQPCCGWEPLEIIARDSFVDACFSSISDYVSFYLMKLSWKTVLEALPNQDK